MSKKVLLLITFAISLMSIRFICQLRAKEIRIHAVKLTPFNAMKTVVKLEQEGQAIGKVHFDSTNIYLELNEKIELFAEDQLIYKESILGNGFVDFVKASAEIRKNKLQVGFDTIEIKYKPLQSQLDSNTNKKIVKQFDNIKNALDTIITEVKLDTGLNNFLKSRK